MTIRPSGCNKGHSHQVRFTTPETSPQASVNRVRHPKKEIGNIQSLPGLAGHESIWKYLTGLLEKRLTLEGWRSGEPRRAVQDVRLDSRT